MSRKKASGSDGTPTVTDLGPILGEYRAQGITTFNLKVQRRTPNGKWVNLGGDFNALLWDTDDLLKGKLEEWIRERAGGQCYFAWFRNPDDLTQTYFRYEMNLPGSSIDAKTLSGQVPQGQAVSMSQMGFMPLSPQGMPGMPQPQQPQQAPQYVNMNGVMVPLAAQLQGLPLPQKDAQGRLIGPPANMLPSHVTNGGYDVRLQWDMFYDMLRQQGKLQDNQNMHWAMTFDQRSQEKDAQIARLQEQLAAKEREAAKESAALRTEFSREIQQLRSELTRKTEEQREERHQAELRMLKAEIQGAQAKPTRDIDWVGIGGVLAPVITGVIGAMSNRSTSDRNYQLEMAKLQSSNSEAQQKQLTALLAKPKDDGAMLKQLVPLLTAVAPTAMGAIKEFMESPVRAMEAKQDHSIMLMKMLSETLVAQAQAQGDVPFWAPILENLAENIGPAAQNVIMGLAERKMQAEGQQTRPLPPQSQPGAPHGASGAGQHAGQQGVPTVLSDGLFERFAAQSAEHRRAANDVAMIFRMTPPKHGFHTHEWRMLLLNLHLSVDAQQIAQFIAGHIVHSAQFELLPEVLEGVLEKPEEKLGPILLGLPIAKRDAEYVKEVLGLTVAVLKQIVAAQNANGMSDVDIIEVDEAEDEDDAVEEDDGEVEDDDGPLNGYADEEPAASLQPQA